MIALGGLGDRINVLERWSNPWGGLRPLKRKMFLANNSERKNRITISRPNSVSATKNTFCIWISALWEEKWGIFYFKFRLSNKIGVLYKVPPRLLSNRISRSVFCFLQKNGVEGGLGGGWSVFLGMRATLPVGEGKHWEAPLVSYLRMNFRRFPAKKFRYFSIKKLV